MDGLDAEGVRVREGGLRDEEGADGGGGVEACFGVGRVVRGLVDGVEGGGVLVGREVGDGGKGSYLLRRTTGESSSAPSSR